MTSQTCMFRIDEKNIDVIFEVCCMSLHLIEAEAERNIRLGNSYFHLYKKHSSKNNYHLANLLCCASEEYELSAKRLKSVAETTESIMQMQFDKCSFGFEVSGMDIPLEHMHTILAYAREYRNT